MHMSFPRVMLIRFVLSLFAAALVLCMFSQWFFTIFSISFDLLYYIILNNHAGDLLLVKLMSDKRYCQLISLYDFLLADNIV